MAKTINFPSKTNVLKHNETSQLPRKIVFYLDSQTNYKFHNKERPKL